jgi:hypothetical protein
MDKRSFEKRLDDLEVKAGGYAIGVQRIDDKHDRLVSIPATRERIEEERFRARYPHGLLIRVVRKPMQREEESNA